MNIIYIHEQGAYLRKSAGHFVLSKKEKELFSIPESSVDQIVIFGNIQITSQAIGQLLSKGIQLIYLSCYGKFKGLLLPGFPKNIFVRIAQYKATTDSIFSLKTASLIVREKIENQIKTIAKWQRNLWIDNDTYIENLKKVLLNIDNATTIAQLMGLEAISSKIYFIALGKSIPPPFLWNGRNRQPPKDPVNALLSLTYMMTLSQIISQCYANALDPYLGFLHQLDYSRPSLALDLLEAFRALYCDHFVVRSFQQEIFSESDFSYSAGNGCRLTENGFKKYIEKYHIFHISDKINHIPLQKKINKNIANLKNEILAVEREI